MRGCLQSNNPLQIATELQQTESLLSGRCGPYSCLSTLSLNWCPFRLSYFCPIKQAPLKKKAFPRRASCVAQRAKGCFFRSFLANILKASIAGHFVHSLLFLRWKCVWHEMGVWYGGHCGRWPSKVPNDIGCEFLRDQYAWEGSTHANFLDQRQPQQIPSLKMFLFFSKILSNIDLILFLNNQMGKNQSHAHRMFSNV